MRAYWRVLTAFLAAGVLSFPAAGRAMDYTVTQYGHGGEVVDVNLPPELGGANAKMTCVGEGGPAGGWEVACKYPLCYYVFGRGGIVCDYIDEAGTPDFTFDMCTPLAHDTEKQFCTTDAARIVGVTGDDMFRIKNGAGGFFEYHRIDREREHSLKWIEWVPTAGITQDAMIPAGPPGTFQDFTDFLDDPPSFIRVKKACYPGTVELCDNPPPPKPGACGPAVSHGPYLNAPEEELRCRIGKSSVPGKGERTWNWTCDPLRGGTVVPCSARRIVDAQCGPANGRTFATSAELAGGGLCSVGSAASVPGGTGPWSWTCNPPIPGGKKASCSAKTSTTPISSCVSIAYMPPDMRWDVGSGHFYLGAVGDNYWCSGPCKQFDRAVYFYVEDVSKITQFVMTEEGWDDIMEVRINGVRVWHSRGGAGPWNGGASCELSTSWQRTDVVNMRPFLRNGLNVYELRTWVQGCGESWSRGRLVDNCR